MNTLGMNVTSVIANIVRFTKRSRDLLRNVFFLYFRNRVKI